MSNFEKTEKDFKLKYFYFINPETVIESIENSEEFEKFIAKPDELANIEKFFHRTFSTIFDSASEYTKFLEPTTIMHSSFFSSNTYDLTVSMASLLKLSLRNHCIMHGFFNSLNHLDYVSISARNSYLNSVGYFESSENEEESYKIDSNLSIYQQYTNYYKRLSPEDYSYQLLYLFGEKVDTTGKGFHFQLPRNFKEFGDYLMTESYVKTVNKNLLQQHTRIIFNYDNLYYSTKEFIQNRLTNNADRLLFSFPMEYCYCFSTINSMKQFLTTINQSTIQENLSLKDLEGQVLLNIISDLPRCRLVYSRHFFLKYACNAVLHSSVSKSPYLEINPDNIVSHNPDPQKIQNKNLLVNTGLSNIEKFIQTINNFTIPILEDLWTVCFNHIKQDLQNIDLSRIYKKYIDKNYDILTSDFTLLSNEQIKSCSSLSNIKSINCDTYIGPRFSLNSLRQELMQAQNMQVQNLNNINTMPLYVKKSLIQILHSSLNIDKINSPYNDNMIYEIINSNASDVYNYSFKINHIRSLIDLLYK